jgi:RHH-type proline utilization regulon transcriptional repressor/proline dehydrogenase/delta 1-pyrroline-5-carboxylate dehydrogenase
MVRLVKGAYWDSEIKRAQVDGLDGYPVYTRKAYTDVAYLACARRLLAAPDAVFPQFATHNAHTLAAIYHLAGGESAAPEAYEFQCLHGMGEPLYEQVVGPLADGRLGRPCRIYAPVGTHETLLAYLVRRLLENGANTSFVNRIADASVPIEALVEDPVTTVERSADAEADGVARVLGRPHPAIPLPREIYGAARANSRGLDLSNEDALAALADALRASRGETWTAAPTLAGDVAITAAGGHDVLNPADHDDIVGRVREATLADVERAVASAAEGAPAGAATSASDRAALLERAADGLEADLPRLLGLLAREAGKTYPNGIAEVREAVDFLRFYAAQARRDLGGGEVAPLGPVVCISPWNFPLAIFTGQVAAALAAGNPVLAKPAEQTPLIAAEMVRRLRAAGVPAAALQLVPGRGETVGAALVADPRVQGVMFTGSTEVARLLQKSLARRLNAAGRAVPLIAETGGQNAMLVDSSALAEQVVSDVVASAFDSAGQRCSALRVLCLQEDGADRIVAMLKGAMAESRIGAPDTLAVDVGPVIDAEARSSIEAHVATLRARGRPVFEQARGDRADTARGTFVRPTLIELKRLDELEREVFGPVLHVVRYRRRDLAAMIEQVNATGYGLTLGVQSRIDETIAQVVAGAHVGNVYVNRNMVGAVVGVQPFGGEGLSGTGPKAGGPLYLYRLLARRPADAMTRALAVGSIDASPAPELAPALRELQRWAESGGDSALAATCTRYGNGSCVGVASLLAGPTGERNVYTLQPRDAVLCLAGADRDRLVQLAAVLAVGSRAIWPHSAAPLAARLPEAVRARLDLVADWMAPGTRFDAVLHHGSADELLALGRVLAERAGPIVGVEGLRPGETELPLERLVVERALSINTAAAGGNATLMTLQ